MEANTLFLRLEGPLQAWGDNQSKFVIRRTADAPTKSGVLGMACAALGISRADARARLDKLNTLALGVRIDRPGVRWWDYHTVGAGLRMQIAERRGRTKSDTMLTRREYLCDASFLIALQGDADLIRALHRAFASPAWPPFLGRKACPPGLPLLGRSDEQSTGHYATLKDALCTVPWRPRLAGDPLPESVTCLLEWRPSKQGELAPPSAEVWHDVARSYDVPGHEPRLVIRAPLSVGDGGDVALGPPRQPRTPAPLRPRADYRNGEYRRRRQARLEADHGLCVFCKLPATTVQHVTYRRAGGDEAQDDLRSLCRLCHDAVTMIEYGMGMGLDRINPEDPNYRDQIIRQRGEIIRFRSLETRRRHLKPQEVE